LILAFWTGREGRWGDGERRWTQMDADEEMGRWGDEEMFLLLQECLCFNSLII